MTRLATAFATGLLALLIGTIPASAQSKKASGGGQIKIAVIDIDHIRREATAVKAAREQVAKYHTAFQADIQKEEAELRNANQELARQRSILSPEAFAEERRKFEQRLVEVQRLVQVRRQQLDDVQNDFMRRMNEVMAEVVNDIAKENGYTVILRLDQSVFASESVMITSQVLERLNKKLPTIKVPEPGKTPAPGKAPAPGK